MADASFRVSRRRACRTQDVLRHAIQLAHQVAQLPLPAEPTDEQRPTPLLPVSVDVPGPSDALERRQHLLFRLGDAAWDPKSAATRLAWTLGIAEKEEKSLEEELTRQALPFKRYAMAAESGKSALTDMHVLLPVYVKRGSLVLRDEVDLHIGSLGGCGHSMASAVQIYASTVCKDLGLGPTWLGAVMRHLGTVISDVNEDIKAGCPSDLEMPLTAAASVRTASSSLPCVQEADPELDAVERERTRRREEKMIQRQKQRKDAAQQQQAQGAPQLDVEHAASTSRQLQTAAAPDSQQHAPPTVGAGVST